MTDILISMVIAKRTSIYCSIVFEFLRVLFTSSTTVLSNGANRTQIDNKLSEEYLKTYFNNKTFSGGFNRTRLFNNMCQGNLNNRLNKL